VLERLPSVEAEAQPEEGVTHAPKVTKGEARLDFTKTAEEVERQVRAFNPVPGAFFEANGQRVKVLECGVLGCCRGWDAERGGPGTIVGDGRGIRCGRGYIAVGLVQRAGKSPMRVEEFVRGFPLPSGTQAG